MKLRILSLSADQELALLRKRVLESAGHEVVSPHSEKEALEAASGKNRFDVAIVCYRMWTGTSRRLMRVSARTIPLESLSSWYAYMERFPRLKVIGTLWVSMGQTHFWMFSPK